MTSAPVDAKVKTGATAASVPALLYGLFMAADVRQAAVAGAVALISALSAFGVGWLTKHTPR